MTLKIIIENESDQPEEQPCPKCDAMQEMDHNYCCECGTKMPQPKVSARLGTLSKMASNPMINSY
jgi:hypothetical protein